MRLAALIAALALQASVAFCQTAPLARLPSPDVASGVDFGHAVGVSGTVAAVGGPGAEEQGGLTPGAVTLFERGSDGLWSRRQRLTPSSFGQGRIDEQQRFGQALALEGNRLVVGAPGEDDGTTPEAGAVYIYERQASGSWAEVAVLRDLSPVASGAFGSAVALSGSRLLATASGDRPDGAGGTDEGGTVYVFERDPTGFWAPQDTLRRPASEGRVSFGVALSLDGTRALIGARGSASSPVNTDGRAYIYEQTAAGWTEVAAFQSPDPRAGGVNKQFGDAVALQGDRVLVGAWGQGIQVGGLGAVASGVTYVFQRGASGTWSLRQRLIPDDLDRAELSPPRQIQFGFSIALDGDRAVVTARRDVIGGAAGAGSVYVFAETDGTWSQRTKLKGSGTASSEFGFSTALFNRTVVTGERLGGESVFRPGVAFVHTSERIVLPPTPGPTPPPPVLLGVQETVGVRDALGLREALQLLVQEAVGVEDGPDLRGSLQVFLQETVGVRDGSGLRESLQLFLRETVDVSDGSGLRESIQLFLRESVDVNDASGFRASLQLILQESVGVNDAVDLRESLRLFLQETVGVRDEADLRESLRVFLRETVGVADTSGLRTSLELLVRESIGVQDDTALAGALALLIQEGIRVGDAMNFTRPDSSLASGAAPVFIDTERVAFLGPVGMRLEFSGVGSRGGVSVFFEEAAPEAPDGIPDGATLAPYRWTLLGAEGLTFDSVRVALDPETLPRLSITDGEAITVYQRPASGESAFAPLRTTLGSDTGEIIGNGLTNLGEVTLAGTGFVVGTEEEGPVVFGLSAPAPNPARALSRIVLSLPEPGPAQVDVLDLRGRRVATLVQGDLPAGRTTLQIRADTFASGSYIIVFRSGDQFAISRLTVIR